jgi:hypothetical protein
MIKYSMNNLIGFEIDEGYPWKDTLFINSDIASTENRDYEKCRAIISVLKLTKLDTSDCRDIGDNVFIGADTLVDLKYGVRIERKGTHHIILKVTQECNEWLIICAQLLLLELNCTLIHAAALEKNGQVILLPSWGGVGKTATVMRMIQEEWCLLGDDLVILHANEVLPFLKPFVIYPYHRTLFPEVFAENRGRIVTNLKLNKIMSKTIPVVKRLMRTMPGVLAFARKHNPQSMRISPSKIFNKEQLSHGGKLKKIVWLERVIENQISYTEKSAEAIASKTVSVSMMEIFSDRISFVLALCGVGVFDYKKIHIKMYDLITTAYGNNECYELDIPTSIPIEEVGTIVLKQVVHEKNHLDKGRI